MTGGGGQLKTVGINVLLRALIILPGDVGRERLRERERERERERKVTLYTLCESGSHSAFNYPRIQSWLADNGSNSPRRLY